MNKVTKASMYLYLLLITTFLFTAFKPAGPDIVVKVIKDDLVKSKKCSIGVLRNGSYKSLDTKYKILTFEFTLLNSRGKAKFHKKMDNPEVDLSDVFEVDFNKGDLILIENVVVVNVKSGDVIEFKKATDRYLIR